MPQIDDVWNGLNGGSYGPTAPDSDLLIQLAHTNTVTTNTYMSTRIFDDALYPGANIMVILQNITLQVDTMESEFQSNIVDIPDYPSYNITDDLNDGTHGLAAIRAFETVIEDQVIDLGTDLDGVSTALESSFEDTDALIDTVQTTVNTILTTVNENTILDGFAQLAKAAGGSIEVSLVELLTQLVENPPYSLLSHGSTSAVVSGGWEYYSSGVYGYIVTLDVPANWGKRAGDPVFYTPSIARVAFATADGYVENPEEIFTSPILLWPLTPSADRFRIALEVGITATITLLQL